MTRLRSGVVDRRAQAMEQLTAPLDTDTTGTTSCTITRVAGMNVLKLRARALIVGTAIAAAMASATLRTDVTAPLASRASLGIDAGRYARHARRGLTALGRRTHAEILGPVLMWRGRAGQAATLVLLHRARHTSTASMEESHLSPWMETPGPWETQMSSNVRTRILSIGPGGW